MLLEIGIHLRNEIMETLIPLAVTFFIGAIVSMFDILTLKYRKVSAFLVSSPYLYVYAVFFGVISILVLWCLQNNIFPAMPLDGNASFLSNAYVQAFIVGMLTKSFLDIKIFSIANGTSKSTPIGVKTLTVIFEEPLLDKIESEWFKNFSRFIDMVEQKYQDKVVADINNIVVSKLRNFPDSNRAVIFLNGSFAQAIDKREQFTLVMREFGKGVFCEIFNC
jgi:hypothetical protein